MAIFELPMPIIFGSSSKPRGQFVILFVLDNVQTTFLTFPESCLLICLGTAVGAMAYYKVFQEDSFQSFNARTFFLYLLPPIMLEVIIVIVVIYRSSTAKDTQFRTAYFVQNKTIILH